MPQPLQADETVPTKMYRIYNEETRFSIVIPISRTAGSFENSVSKPYPNRLKIKIVNWQNSKQNLPM